MNWKILLVLCISVLLYLTAGAFLFQYLERKPTAGQPINSTAAYVNFTKYLAEQYPCLDDEERTQLVAEIITEYNAGVIGLPGAVEENPWEISRSFFFVSTVITTIGYGNSTPVTAAGQLATVAYALIGIPLCLIFLAGIGENIVKLLMKIERLCSVCEKCTTLCHVVRVLLLIMAGWITFIMIPAWIFSIIEGWSYTESFYFAFVTLSTIGFGDMVPSSASGDKYPFYRVASVIWVYIGLAWLSSLVSLLSDVFQRGMSEGESRVEERLKKSHQELATKLKRFGSHTDSTHTAFENTVDSVDNDIQRESKENNNIQPVISDEDSQEKSDVQLDKDRGSKEIVATPDGVVTVSL